MTAPAQGTCYKFTVRSASEAARLIRERLGESARVLSVRNVEATGLSRLWSAPRLEVIAQVDGPATDASAAAAPDAASAPADESAVVTPMPAARAARPAVAAPGDLRTLLQRAGYSAALLTRLARSPEWARLAALPLHRGLVETGRHLRALAAPAPDAAPLRRAAFIGPCGVGRTTALCKWLALETFRHARTGHVVIAEFERANPAGALPVFCEALGVPLAHFPALTQPATPEGFVYFDLPGFSLRDRGANRSLARFLEEEGIDQRVLVLNAAYDPALIRAGLETGRALGATHLAFTHLDEVTRWGRLWDYVLESGLEPLLLATGPSLTGDCEEDVLDALVRRTLPAADDSDHEPETETADEPLVTAA